MNRAIKCVVNNNGIGSYVIVVLLFLVLSNNCNMIVAIVDCGYLLNRNVICLFYLFDCLFGNRF